MLSKPRFEKLTEALHLSFSSEYFQVSGYSSSSRVWADEAPVLLQETPLPSLPIKRKDISPQPVTIERNPNSNNL